jgi:hypothetical protein
VDITIVAVNFSKHLFKPYLQRNEGKQLLFSCFRFAGNKRIDHDYLRWQHVRARAYIIELPCHCTEATQLKDELHKPTTLDHRLGMEALVCTSRQGVVWVLTGMVMTRSAVFQNVTGSSSKLTHRE